MSAPVFFPVPVARKAGGAEGVQALIRQGESAEGPGDCFRLDEHTWKQMGGMLADERERFIGLWCDQVRVLAVLDQGTDRPLAAALELEGPRYPALSDSVPAAETFERMISDLFGVDAMGGCDGSVLLDRGGWTVSAPLSSRPGPGGGAQDTGGDTACEQSVLSGPADGVSAAPFCLRMLKDGLRVQRSETLRGFAHRGVAQQMSGAVPGDAVRIAGRVCAASSAAHQWAFCRAAEQISGVRPGERAMLCRAVFAETERCLTHLATLSRVARLAGSGLVSSRLAGLREALVQILTGLTGSRSLMDRIVPGGIYLPVSQGTAEGEIVRAVAVLAAEYAALLTQTLPGLRDLWRTRLGPEALLAGCGPAGEDVCHDNGVDGPAARAAGRERDSRVFLPVYGRFRIPVQKGGDARARCLQYFAECRSSGALLSSLSGRLSELVEDAPLSFPGQGGDGWGYGKAAGPAGEVHMVIRMRQGRIDQVMIRNPSMLLIPLADSLASGVFPEEAALIRASLGFSAAAADL
ncbi:hypothetical protein LOC54_09355 [Acetobacter sp. AN02]|uniref:NADH-quinone oxidoreductase subunit D-related protein n=1 Tax=Acetobacter sp. AN02 TaxID=2894186 RepID=UPI002434253C|nr:hypothetical protein [Acetobacter sp. AN02]MDG6095306.1 hypothetical protein [Acetobacter sp. AN02]